MMINRKIKLIFLASVLGLGLTACGDDSADTAPAVQETTQAASEAPAEEAVTEVQESEQAAEKEAMTGDTLEAYDPDVPSMIVEDNGAIQQEEIYKNWPTEDTASDNGTPDAASSTPAATEAKEHIVAARATSFSPNILFINPGDTVKWINMTIHDSVSMDGLIPEGAEPWAFKIGQNGAVTLTEEGIYIYKCNPHYPNGMVSAIIVGEPVNFEQIKANATGRSKGTVIKIGKALAAR